MAGSATGVGEHELAFEAFGVRAMVSASRAEDLERMSAVLPPGWRPCPATSARKHFALVRDASGAYGLTRDGQPLYSGFEREFAFILLEAELRADVALRSPDAIFVHAGVVAHRGQAVLIPGKSFSGKTTLVAAMVRAGSVYYSDEFALLDADGLVHPYAKPLSLRDEDHVQTEHGVESLGGVAGEAPLPVGAVIVTTYRPGAEWRPARLSPGEGALALLSHTVPAQERPAEAMRAVTRAVDGAMVLRGERGDAEALVPRLLAELEP
jgi:hypothetical protein